MSGIGGFIDNNLNSLNAANACEKMLAALKGRGKDIHGTYISEEICLIHTRYSHLDEGRQPIRIVVGSTAYVMVYDGELYNKNELRKDLKEKGHNFHETSDAAHILYSYITWGENFLNRLNGVFAFVIWDGQKLFAARDRLGVKPLFYSITKHGLVFASAIKAMLTHPKIESVINSNGIAEMILLGPGKPMSSGVIKNINELIPGHFAVYTKSNGIEINKYWSLKAKIHTDNFKQTVENLKYLLTDIIKGQNFGQTKKPAVLLSGGVDSSAISALSKTKESFSVDFVGNDKFYEQVSKSDESDSKYVRQMINFLRLKHKHIILGSDELANTLEEAVLVRGLPGMADIDSALLLFLNRVREDTPIVFSGEGADEIFGGYKWYNDSELLFKEDFPWAESAEIRSKYLISDFSINGAEFIKEHYEKTIKSADILYDDSGNNKRVRQMFVLNLEWFLQCLLTRSDSMSGAAGVSVRTPFLDHRLVEYLYNVPWEFKNHGGVEKGLMREVLKGVLPKEVLTRKKSPFPKTHNNGYLERVKDMLQKVIDDNNSPLFQIISKDEIKKLQEGNINKNNWYGQLMSYPQTIAYFLQINFWLKNFSVKVEK